MRRGKLYIKLLPMYSSDASPAERVAAEKETDFGGRSFPRMREAETGRSLATWLGWRDSNPLYRSQSPVCYHYTTSQYGQHRFLDKKAGTAGLFAVWGGIWGSNPRHPEPQSGALPTELIPPNDILYKTPRGGCTLGTPRGIRTPDLLLRRQLLYPAELLAHIQPSTVDGAGDGNRTHVSSLEGWCSTIELHPHGSLPHSAKR